jgi:hypothetical protein
MINITRSVRSLMLLLAMMMLTQVGWGQTTLFSDNFGTSRGSTYTAAAGVIGNDANWVISRSGTDWGAKIDGGRLDITNDASIQSNADGWGFGYQDINTISGWNTTLSSNTGTITWEFNRRQIRTDPSGFGSNTYGVAFVLASTNVTAATAGSGYAVVLGQSGTTDPIRLAHFNNGLQGTLTNIITSNTTSLVDFGADYISVRVTYIPSNNTWELFLRNDGSSSFTDPTSGTLTSQGTAVNSTYTSATGMRYVGGYWQGSTGSTQTAFFDNVYLKKTVTVPAAPTIGTITPGDGQLGVAFTAGSDGGSAITDYKWSVDGTNYTTRSGTSSPIVITGLTNGTAYTVRIRAVNAIGDGTVATAGSTATPRTTPAAPTITGITPGNNQLSVAFTAPSSNGGASITNYEYSINGGTDWVTPSPAVTTSPLLITGLTNGTTYDIQLRAVNSAGSGVASSTVQGTPVVPPLPVSLLSFSGYKNGVRNQLRWVTASELNNSGFEVQRSTDGQNYEPIGFVNSLAIGGNSQTQLKYNFTDANPNGLKQYYRLKQFDIDGRSSLSNILLIQGDKPSAFEIASVYPNPSRGQVTVLLNAPDNKSVTIRLIDLGGRVLQTRQVNVLAGNNSIPFDISNLGKGQYLISVGEKSVKIVRE